MMQRFERPKEPVNFKETVKECKEALEQFFNTKPSANPPAKPDFPNKWGAFKTHFSDAQYGKCAYCEMAVTGGQAGDVEHFYPKGEIWELHSDPKNWGTERTSASTVAGRKRNVISNQGYWWLAYDWNNYLLSCQVCNQYWKLSYFPVRNSPRNVPPTKDLADDPLMLNPYSKKYDPARHLYFDVLGQIQARDRSIHGAATIRTCGLDRESLRKWRNPNAKRAHFLVRELAKAKDRAATLAVLCDFQRLGDSQIPHSGMVRAIFQEGSGMKWDKLEKILSKRPCQ